MQKGTVLRIKGFGAMGLISRNGTWCLIVAVLSAGVILGALAGQNIGIVSFFADKELKRVLSLHAGDAFLKITLDSFMASCLWFLPVFAFGTSVLGPVLVPLCGAVRGMILGAVTGLLYSEYSVKGIAFHAVLVLPSTAVFLIAYLLAQRESFRFSVMMVKLTASAANPADLSADFKNYCGRYIVLIGIVLLSALIDAVFTLLFSSSFGLS